MTDEDERKIHRVEILHEHAPDDRATLAALRLDPRVTQIDLWTRQHDQLGRLLPRPTDELLNEPARWVYYPWRRTLANILGPRSFRRLRLDRNRNKISSLEQERFTSNTVGIVGISVGHVIAQSLALEGLLGEIRLMDTELVEGADLNRIPAPTVDLGLNKAIAAARQIAEIDPYLPVRVYTSEFSPELCEEFLDGVDVVVEESFPLTTKIGVRRAARSMGIPVLMATSNRGLLDVERFDLDPQRPLFHNLLSEAELSEIAESSGPHLKYHYRLLESDLSSVRLMATRFELGRTLSSWPQLGSELQIAGATVSAAVRRIVLGAALPSGRVRLDLDDHLDQMTDPTHAKPARTIDSATRKNLDVLVTRIATKLMSVDSTTVIPTTLSVLSELRDFFDADHVSLRHNDRKQRSALLVAEWPLRDVVPDPDPHAAIRYADADVWDAVGEYAVEPRIGCRGGHTLLTAPLVDGGESLGYLTLTTTGDRTWDSDAVDSVTAIATLFATLKKRLEAEERLRYLAAHDDLTDLSNRRALIEHMEKRLQPGMPGPVATMFIDLDRFKALNDFVGHSAGDAFIRAVAARLREHAGPDDMIARLGGDEFVVIPHGELDADGAKLFAKNIQTLIDERIEIGGERVSRSASIGVAICMPGEVSVSDLLRQADHAMLNAKASGGSGIAFFTEEMRADRHLRDDIELHLRHAVESDSLVLHYQPEVDLRTGRIRAVEALVRWRHPTRGLLYPSAFIEVAEATNLAGELGRWVMRRATRQLAEWRAKDLARDIVMRINVSPIQLVSPDFVSLVKGVLKEHALDGDSVCFEITEHVVVQDMQRTRITLAGLREIGATVAIDDFGTGHSSLTHLKDLQVNALKIDRGFVAQLGTDVNDLAIVKLVVDLATALELDIVAEGVETELAAQTLMRLGCERAQGYLISRPIPPDELEPMLEAGTIPIG